MRTRMFAIVMSCLLASPAAYPQDAAQPAPADPLQRDFLNPPAGARPRVWWHWMNGNITKEGIKLDLEWMKRVGIGGLQNFDAALATPKVVDKRLAYMTPEWKEAFHYAVALADQFGLEMAIASSPGWSETGGPWVKPEQAMKKLVWSETRVAGGRDSPASWRNLLRLPGRSRLFLIARISHCPTRTRRRRRSITAMRRWSLTGCPR